MSSEPNAFRSGLISVTVGAMIFGLHCHEGAELPGGDAGVEADLSTAPDLATADAKPAEDLVTAGDLASLCGGATIYRLPTGTYLTQLANVQMDTCKDGVMPADLMKARQVENDVVTGNIIVKGSTGAELGRGPVRCNVGTLTFGPATIDDGFCRYTTNRSSKLTVTADGTFTLELTDNRSNTMNIMSCPQPSTCTVKWTAIMKM